MIPTSITLTHPSYPDLSVTFGAPSEEAWGAAIDTIAKASSKEAGLLAAGYNVVIATAKGIPRAEIPTLIDDWPAITMLAIGKAAELGGALRLDVSAGADLINTWRFDLAATVAAGKEIAQLRATLETDAIDATRFTSAIAMIGQGGVRPRLEELLEEHEATLSALQASGLTLEMCADLLARYNRRGQLLALRTRDHGVIVARRPTFQASLAYANDANESGAYEAGKRLCIACVVSPIEGAIAPRLASFPAFTTTLAGLIRGTSDEGMAAIVKKG